MAPSRCNRCCAMIFFILFRQRSAGFLWAFSFCRPPVSMPHLSKPVIPLRQLAFMAGTPTPTFRYSRAGILFLCSFFFNDFSSGYVFVFLFFLNNAVLFAMIHMQGWSPEPDEYKDLPQRSREGHSSNAQSPYIQIDLLKEYNITGTLLYLAKLVSQCNTEFVKRNLLFLSPRGTDPRGWCVRHVRLQLIPAV